MRHENQSCARMLEYRPPRIAMSLLAGATALQIVLPAEWLSLKQHPVAASGIGLAGFLIMLRAWWLFRNYETAICPTAESTTLITTDIYSLTRNPMYLGMILILLGIALFSGSWLFYLVAGTYVLILNSVFCRFEERRLHDQYGEPFGRYTQSVRRWI